MLYRLIISIFCLLLCSCLTDKQKEPVSVLQHQAIDLGERFIGSGGFLDFYQGTIIGLDLSPTMQPFFRFMPNEPSLPLFYFGNRGQGPHDFLRPLSIQFVSNQAVGTLDIMSNTYVEFSIPNENEVLITDKKIRFQTPLTQIIKTAFNQYIGLLGLSNEMFLLADSSGMPVKSFFEYPYQDNDERLFATRSHAYQGTLAANPSKNKFVYSSFKGEIIHFYEIENNNIKTVAKIEKVYPKYRKLNEENRTGVEFHADGTDGYIDVYATEKFVYAIFSGKKIFDRKTNVRTAFEGTGLRIFDWNGILVKEYELDVPCNYLCVSDDDSKIWAIATCPDISLVFFDLEHEIEITAENENEQGGEVQIKRNLLESQLINGGIYISIDSTMDSKSLKDSIMSRIISIINDNSLSINPDDIVDIQIETVNRNTIRAPLILKKTE